MSNVERIERMIIKTIVEDALDLGYMVVLHDGEDKAADAYLDSTTSKEHEVAQIMQMIRATDEERLIFFKDGKRVGSVLLVYGNDGHDVIADHTASDELDALLAGATKLADRLSERGAA